MFYLFLIFLLILFIFTLLNNLNIFNTKKEFFKQDICCFYAYYEKNNLYKNNFKYFLENGILNNVDYYIILNGNCSINIPKRDNIKVYQRKNTGFDFGAYSYAIHKLNKIYDYYFFINTSVCGPYLKDNDKEWIDHFLELFNKDVKLVGTSINIYPHDNFSKKYNLSKLYNKSPPYSHIQSMFFGMDKEYFNYLIDIDFFNEEELNNVKDIKYVIAKKEIGLSQHAINQGWNINSILSKYKNIDYRTLNKNFNYSAPNGDPYFKNKYFGNNIDKYDAIFFKNNRDL